jgi:hypothetical protein
MARFFGHRTNLLIARAATKIVATIASVERCLMLRVVLMTHLLERQNENCSSSAAD